MYRLKNMLSSKDNVEVSEKVPDEAQGMGPKMTDLMSMEVIPEKLLAGALDAVFGLGKSDKNTAGIIGTAQNEKKDGRRRDEFRATALVGARDNPRTDRSRRQNDGRSRSSSGRPDKMTTATTTDDGGDDVVRKDLEKIVENNENIRRFMMEFSLMM
jgi:hypothetical protein